jgi:AcrR family transcriptional regulator
MTELSPRERRHQRTQQAILDAARDIINKQGIESLSIRAIADKIDYSPAGLYEYYASKEEIVAELVLQGFRRFARHLDQVDKSLPAEEYLVELGVAYLDFAVKNSDFFLLMFTTAPLAYAEYFQETRPHSATALQSDDAFGILLRGVDRCVQAGFFHVQPNYGLFEMAHAAWSLVHGIAMLQITLLSRMPLPVEQIRTTVRMLHVGMRSL